MLHRPGALSPVNRIGVEGVDGLFAVTERLGAFLSVAGAAEDLCLVAVGATMVGKVRVTFMDAAPPPTAPMTTDLHHPAYDLPSSLTSSRDRAGRRRRACRSVAR
mgnify:CR=1 FL=1